MGKDEGIMRFKIVTRWTEKEDWPSSKPYSNVESDQVWLDSVFQLDHYIVL